MTYLAQPLAQTLGFDLASLNRKFDRAYPKEILTWCALNIPEGLVQVSNFNLEDLAIADLLYRQIKPIARIPVLFVDTLYHFSETLDFVEQAQHLYNLDLHVYKVKDCSSRKAFAAKYGGMLWENDLEKFHYLTKVEPLQRGLEDLKAVAWISGRQRTPLRGTFQDCTPTHANLPVFEWDKQGRLKINPLANWSRTESWAYVYENDTIYHPLHDRGYPCIGDEPITFEVSDPEKESLQHWYDSQKTEAFVHSHF